MASTDTTIGDMHEADNVDEDPDKDFVRTASTTVASLWTPALPQSKLLRRMQGSLLSEHGQDSKLDKQNSASPQSRMDTKKKTNAHSGAFDPPSAAFCRLSVSTDLNRPPSNWLISKPGNSFPFGIEHLAGFNPTIHFTGFSSFSMASHFLECLSIQIGVDVVSDAENIKKLLQMPYSEAAVSMVVHRIGKTLLIDELDLHRILLNSSDEEWVWLRKFFLETIFKLVGSRHKALDKKDKSRSAIAERNLISKFYYRSLIDSSNAIPRQTVQPEFEPGSQQAHNLPLQLPPLPEPSPDNLKVPEPSRSASHDFARTLLWNFEDIRMLIGSDMPIFGDADHPSVSLRLHNMQRSINILTGLDYWLDNLMCQVPEVLMCYHLNGIVQKYELLKTEDLPRLSEHCKFSPGTIRDVAKNILAFLKTNAAKEGHTYWLFKAKNDDVVKLYDLSSLCEKDQDCSQDNPFRTAVSMLLYKVARNILNGAERKKEEPSAMYLLTKCLELLDKAKFPHIASSVHYMLSDIFIPNDIDPIEASAPPRKPPKPRKKSKRTGDKTTAEEDSRRRKACMSRATMAMVRVPSLCKAAAEAQEPDRACVGDGDGSGDADADVDNDDDDDEQKGVGEETMWNPSFLKMGSLNGRCQEALSHIIRGLSVLDTFAAQREEREQRDRKQREQHERDNPKMAKPLEPIPMPCRPQRDEARSDVELFQKQGAANLMSQMAWDCHLKLVLLRKAFLVLITLAELYFLNGKLGRCLKYVKRALNCRNMSRQLHSSQSDPSEAQDLVADSDAILSTTFSVAGDAYMAMVQNWSSNMVHYQEEFNHPDKGIIEGDLVDQVDEEWRDWLIKLPKDIEEAMLLAVQCLTRASNCLPGDGNQHQPDVKSLQVRLGNAHNELGVFYMSQVSALSEQLEPHEATLLPTPVMHLLTKSEQHLEQAVLHFSAVPDPANVALVLSNYGRLHRVHAYHMGFQDHLEPARALYEKAIDCYLTALTYLGCRRRNPSIWDKVAWELSTTYLNLGTQLLDTDHVTPPEDLNKQIEECYSKSLKYCDLDQGPEEQRLLRQDRAACVHAQLACLYHRSLQLAAALSSPHYTMQLAVLHYNKAALLLAQLCKPVDWLRLRLSRIELQELSSKVRGGSDANTKKHFATLLDMFVDSYAMLDKLDLSQDSAASVAAEFVKALQHTLLGLYKFQMGKGSKKTQAPAKVDAAKQMYLSCLQLHTPIQLCDLLSILKQLASFAEISGLK